MNADKIKAVLFEALSGLAPETDPSGIDADANLREALDLDSMDFLNLVIALHKNLGIDIPEADYGELQSVNKAIDYLAAKSAG